MSDIYTPSQRSALMRRVRTENTAVEQRVRRALHAKGLRFRLHRHDLPGTPDIVLPRYRTCVFVNGCFWHGHDGCAKAKLPTTRRAFWTAKILKNKERDRNVRQQLVNQGWKVIIVWECRVNTETGLASETKNLLTLLDR